MNPHIFFLLCGAIVLSSSILISPVFFYSTDDFETHFRFAFSGSLNLLAHSNMADFLPAEIADYSNGNTDPNDLLEISNYSFPGLQSASDTVWFIQRLGVWLGVLIHPSVLIMYKLGSLFNALFYLLSIFMIVRVLKKYSLNIANLVMFLSLCPMPIKEAASLSYDVMNNIFAASILTFCFVFYHKLQNSTIKRNELIQICFMIIISVFMPLFCTIKQYNIVLAVPLIVLLFAAILHYYKQRASNFTKLMFLAKSKLAIVVCLATTFAFIVMIIKILLSNAIINEVINKVLTKIAENPLETTIMSFRGTIASTFMFQKPPFSSIILIVTVIAFLFLTLTLNVQFSKLSAIICIVCFTVIWIALYFFISYCSILANFTNSRGTVWLGFDGRYIILLLPLVFPILSILGNYILKRFMPNLQKSISLLIRPSLIYITLFLLYLSYFSGFLLSVYSA